MHEVPNFGPKIIEIKLLISKIYRSVFRNYNTAVVREKDESSQYSYKI